MDPLSFCTYAFANACLPHTKESILTEMIAITIKRVIEALSRQVLLLDGDRRSSVEELKNVRSSLINRVLNSGNSEEAMDVWSEVRTVLEQVFPSSVVSMADIQALPKSMLKRFNSYIIVVRMTHWWSDRCTLWSPVTVPRYYYGTSYHARSNQLATMIQKLMS